VQSKLAAILETEKSRTNIAINFFMLFPPPKKSMNDSLDFVQHCLTAIGYFENDLLCLSATQKRTLQKGMVQNPEGYSVSRR
jgi:hypothetical protein